MYTHLLTILPKVLLNGAIPSFPIPEGMYRGLLDLHSTLRYLILIALIAAIYFANKGRSSGAPYAGKIKKAGLFTLIFADIQFLVGLVLVYVNLEARTNFKLKAFKEMLGNSSDRFFVLEHAVLMCLALLLIHVGYFKAKKATSAIAANKSQFVWFIIALIIILVAIPWPFMPGHGRPWF